MYIGQGCVRGRVVCRLLRKCVFSCLFLLLAFRFQFKLVYSTYLDRRVVNYKEKVSDKHYCSNCREKDTWHLIWGQLVGFLTTPFSFTLEGKWQICYFLGRCCIWVSWPCQNPLKVKIANKIKLLPFCFVLFLLLLLLFLKLRSFMAFSTVYNI